MCIRWIRIRIRIRNTGCKDMIRNKRTLIFRRLEETIWNCVPPLPNKSSSQSYLLISPYFISDCWEIWFVKNVSLTGSAKNHRAFSQNCRFKWDRIIKSSLQERGGGWVLKCLGDFNGPKRNVVYLETPDGVSCMWRWANPSIIFQRENEVGRNRCQLIIPFMPKILSVFQVLSGYLKEGSRDGSV